MITVAYLPSDFDWKEYIFINKDLTEAGITQKESAETHYLTYGIKENRLYRATPNEWCFLTPYDTSLLPKDFNWESYLKINYDLVIKAIDTKDEAEKHFVLYGQKEQRPYNTEKGIHYLAIIPSTLIIFLVLFMVLKKIKK